MTSHTTFRLSVEARTLLSLLSEHFGVSRTAVLEWLIRDEARSRGLIKSGARHVKPRRTQPA